MNVLLSCEHAANRVPSAYEHLFKAGEDVLQTHRAYDIGAERIAARLAQRFQAPCFMGRYTRLLVDLNRSETNRSVFSSFTAELSRTEKEQLLAQYHRPHWAEVEHQLAAWLASGSEVLHLAIHSFTPVLNGVERKADFGLLYDPACPAERSLCREWQQRLKSCGYRVRMNYPYRGTADGIVTAFRKRFAAHPYLGIELEINQSIIQQLDVEQLAGLIRGRCVPLWPEHLVSACI